MKFNYPFIFYATYLQLSIESGDFIIIFFLDLATKKPELFFSNPPPTLPFCKTKFQHLPEICQIFFSLIITVHQVTMNVYTFATQSTISLHELKYLKLTLFLLHPNSCIFWISQLHRLPVSPKKTLKYG
jgi:hypothetical protein